MLLPFLRHWYVIGLLLEAEPSDDVTHLLELLSAELGSDVGSQSRTL